MKTALVRDSLDSLQVTDRFELIGINHVCWREFERTNTRGTSSRTRQRFVDHLCRSNNKQIQLISPSSHTKLQRNRGKEKKKRSDQIVN